MIDIDTNDTNLDPTEIDTVTGGNAYLPYPEIEIPTCPGPTFPPQPWPTDPWS
jgi:hypothetical protein